MAPMSNRHIEDGMGFSGLVPTAAERKQDEYEKALWNKIREKERRVIELESERDRAMTAFDDWKMDGWALLDRDEIEMAKSAFNAGLEAAGLKNRITNAENTIKHWRDNYKLVTVRADELEAERDRLREALQLVDNCIPRIIEDEMDRVISVEAIEAVGKALEETT